MKKKVNLHELTCLPMRGCTNVWWEEGGMNPKRFFIMKNNDSLKFMKLRLIVSSKKKKKCMVQS